MRYTDVQAARVFLERSPYVSWAKQLPAFRHPAFTGVVHPDLPIWAGEPNPPPEPAPGSHASLPRIARLAKTETEALPEFHVQTISGARCGSIKDVKERIAAASDAGASAILMVTGDSGPTKVLPRKGTTGRFDSVRLLKVRVYFYKYFRMGNSNDIVFLNKRKPPRCERAGRSTRMYT